MHTDQQLAQTRLLKGLGVPASSIVRGKATHRWDPRATHVVIPTLKRVTKSMAGMAAGCWLVSMGFVEDSATKGELLDPVCRVGSAVVCWQCMAPQAAYELAACSQMDHDMPRFWRRRREATGERAFEGMAVCVSVCLQACTNTLIAPGDAACTANH